MAVFLCVWHVIKNWVEQLRAKLKDKGKYEHFFKLLYDLLYMRGVLRDVEAAVASLEQECNRAGERRVWEYFKEHYFPILGAYPRQWL